jgi:hypothetical protein
MALDEKPARQGLDYLFDRIFYGEPVPTSPENALGGQYSTAAAMKS